MLKSQQELHEPGTDLDFKPHVFLSFGKVQFHQTKVKNKCQNSRLVQTKCSLVYQANSTSQGQTLYNKDRKKGTHLVF